MESYKATVQSEAKTDPVLKKLQAFMENKKLDEMTADITSVTFEDNHNASTGIRCVKNVTADGLEQHLKDGMSDHQLLVVENLTPRVLKTIGRIWDVDPQFFRDYVDDSEWYRYNEVQDHLPALQYVQDQSSHVCFCFIGPREIIYTDGRKPDKTLEDPVIPAPEKTTVSRIAGMIYPRGRLDLETKKISQLKPVVLTRQKAAAWFSKDNDKGRLRGIILLDPPFPLESKYCKLGAPKFRSFLPTRWWHDKKAQNQHLNLGVEMPEKPGSYRTTFIRYLTQNPNFRNARKLIPFVILQDLVYIIISEWITVHTYVARELGNIDSRLEKGRSRDTKDLECFLATMSILRRRVELYEKLVKEHLLTCAAKGPKSWRELVASCDDENTLHGAQATEIAHTLTTQLQILASNFKTNREKITELSSYFVRLIHVRESQATITQSRSIVALSVVAAILLPFDTTASYMGIQGDLSASGSRRWIYWASSLGVLCLVLVCFLWLQHTDHFPLWRYGQHRETWAKGQLDEESGEVTNSG